MSVPAILWAMNQGHSRNMSQPMWALLVALANEADKLGKIIAGQPRLAKVSRMTTRAVRNLLPVLVEMGLLERTVTAGQCSRYQLLIQPQGEEHGSAQEPYSAQEPHSPTQEPGSSPAPEPRSRVNGSNPGTPRHEPRNATTRTPEPGSPVPYSSQEESLKTREAAAASVPGDPRSPPDGARVSPPSRRDQGTATPPAHNQRSSDAFLDDPSPDDALPAAVRALQIRAAAALRGEVLPPGEVVGPIPTNGMVHHVHTALHVPRRQFHDSHEVDHQMAAVLAGISTEQVDKARRAFEQRARKA